MAKGSGSPQNLKEQLLIDKDGALAPSSLIEYYLDNGALFHFGQTQFFTVSSGGQLQTELETCGSNLKVFSYTPMTLSERFALEIYEAPSRDIDAEESDTDITQLTSFQPNRLSSNTFPSEMYRLADSITHDVSTLDLVFSERFLGSRTTSSVTRDVYSTASNLDTKNHNYVFRINNIEATERDFAIAILFGVPDNLLE